MNTAFLGLGSNLQEPICQIKCATSYIKSLSNTQVLRRASLYRSSPMGDIKQADYINTVIEICTEFTPLDLLDKLQEIELKQGRIRKNERWGPRTIDLDILLFGDLQLSTEKLTIPHYGMKQREFVLYPLFEIAPKLILPDGTGLETLLATCSLKGLEKIEDSDPSQSNES